MSAPPQSKRRRSTNQDRTMNKIAILHLLVNLAILGTLVHVFYL